MSLMSPAELQRIAANGDPKARTLMHRRTGPMARLLFSLPRDVWQRFWMTGNSNVAIADLPEGLQDLARQAAGTTRVTNADGESVVGDLVVPSGRLWLQFGGTVDRQTVWGSMRYGPHGNDFNVLYADPFGRQPPADRRRKARTNPTKAPNAPVFRRKVTLQDHPSKGGYEAGERPSGARPLAEYLRQIAEQVDLPIAAECEYKNREQDKDGRWLQQQWWLAADIVDRPLAEALDLLCADFEYEWQFHEGALLLRPTRWYVDPDERGYVYPKAKLGQSEKATLK